MLYYHILDKIYILFEEAKRNYIKTTASQAQAVPENIVQ
jgi:hypothetical protein